jgi:16S rRNA C1402 (ribose-2'-O) methylase RsmI
MGYDSAHKQEDVEHVILEVLEHRRVATTAEITKAVKDRLVLTSADLKRAAARSSESKIDQIIANALQSKRRLCRDALIERVAVGEFRILAAGRTFLEQRREKIDRVLKTMSDLYSDGDWE